MTTDNVVCGECGGAHEPSGARTDCIRHWKSRAKLAEKVYHGEWAGELRRWLDAQTITPENIGEIRNRCFMPWASSWNALVRDETAAREAETSLAPAAEKEAT